jgi:hypothetical protein
LLAHQIRREAFESLSAFDIVVYQTVQMDGSETGHFLWGLIEKFIHGKVGASGFRMLVYIALCHFSIEGAQRGLTLVKQCLNEHPVTTELDFHLGLLELLRIPDLQSLAFGILDNINDPSTVAPLLNRATIIISWEDPPSVMKLLMLYFYGPKGWMYLPLFVTCLLQFELSERSKLVIEFADKVIESPDTFVKFTRVRFWYSWLFQLFQSSQLDQMRFAMSFARLIDTWLIEAQEHADVRGGCFVFLASYPSIRWLRRIIFKYLLRDGVMNETRFIAIFDSVFEFLFLQFAGTNKLHILLDLDDEGNWLDLEIAQQLMNAFNQNYQICNIDCIQKAAYIAGQLWRAGSENFVAKIVELKTGVEILHSAFAILSRIAAPKIVTGLENYKPAFDDCDDSDAFQLFLFENGLLEKLPALTRTLAEAVASIVKEFTIMREKVLGDTGVTMQKIEDWKQEQKRKVELKHQERLTLFEEFIKTEHKIEGD